MNLHEVSSTVGVLTSRHVRSCSNPGDDDWDAPSHVDILDKDWVEL